MWISATAYTNITNGYLIWAYVLPYCLVGLRYLIFLHEVQVELFKDFHCHYVRKCGSNTYALFTYVHKHLHQTFGEKWTGCSPTPWPQWSSDLTPLSVLL